MEAVIAIPGIVFTDTEVVGLVTITLAVGEKEDTATAGTDKIFKPLVILALTSPEIAMGAGTDQLEIAKLLVMLEDRVPLTGNVVVLPVMETPGRALTKTDVVGFRIVADTAGMDVTATDD